MTIPTIIQAPLGAPAALGMRASVPKTGGVGDPPRYGMTMWFQVIVTDPTGRKKDLGLWSGCTGLKVKMETKVLRSGGEPQTPYLYPDEISYPNITLERAMDRVSAKEVRDWLETVATAWIGSDEGGASMLAARAGGKPDKSGFQGATVTITLFTSLAPNTSGRGLAPQGGSTREVATWILRNAIPVEWEGPSLSAKSGDIAVERLTLMHRGFLKDGNSWAAGGGLSSQGQGRLRLSDSAGKTLQFQYNPTSLTEEMTVRTSDQALQGAVTLVESTGGAPVVFNRKSISFSGLHIEGAKAVKEFHDQLWTWTKSETGEQSGQNKDGKQKVQVLALKMGSGDGGVTINEAVTITKVKFDYQRFTPAGVPCRAVLTLNLMVLTKSDQNSAEGAGR